MKKILSEDRIDYKNYRFGYCINIILDEDDSIEKAFERGYLPYSGDSKNTEEIYYLARSVRINLNRYVRLSENKRVIKKIKSSLKISVHEHKKENFNHDSKFEKFCIKYSKQRFSNKCLSNERLQLIIKRKNYNKIYEFKSGNNPIGYVITYCNNNIIHYWFGFFDTKYLQSVPIGKFMMEHIIHHAKKNDKKYIYLGTCYGKDSLYKVRDFKGIEYFDGNKWIDDIEKLKELCKIDPK